MSMIRPVVVALLNLILPDNLDIDNRTFLFSEDILCFLVIFDLHGLTIS